MISLFFLTTVLISQPTVEYKQPQVATLGGHVALTFGANNTIYSAISTNGGVTFQKPVALSSAGALSLGMHRGPRIAMTENVLVISAIVGEKGKGADGDLLSWRSFDNGLSWAGPVRINDSSGSAREGLHAMSAGGGLIFATWLDLRSQGTRLYGSTSRDGGASWSPNALVYESPSGTVCQCCHPSALVTKDGAIHVMFRNSLAGSRDMYVIKSSDGGKSFGKALKQGAGTWVLNACPMDGGGVAVASRSSIATIWRRNGEIYASEAEFSEAEFIERKLGHGKDPAIVASSNGIYAAWTTPVGLALVRPKSAEPVILDKEGKYVQLVNASGKILGIWERQGTIVVEPL